MPALSARRPAAWIDGPSAIGSVKGMPISIISAPAFGSALMISSEVAGSGSPPIRNVMNAERPCLFNSAKRASMREVMVRRSLCQGRGEEGGGLRKSLLLPPQYVSHLRNVLVAAAGEIDYHQVISRPFRRQLHHLGNGMRRLQRGNDALQPRQQLERGQRLVIGRGQIRHPPGFMQP